MKTATYRDMDGTPLIVEYDENAPCRLCAQPVLAASMGGTDICCWCDLGRCRHCGVSCGMLLKAELDGGRSLRRWREHVANCQQSRQAPGAVSAEGSAVDPILSERPPEGSTREK